MAKGNMLLGYARGKVGDLVFTRLDGEQVTRPRNRHPANPRTNKQLIQRAIMATVMAAYSAGKEIFDHSFQGYSVGAGNQRRFLSLNANMLRTQLASEWDVAAAEESFAKVTAPSIQTPIPNQYIVSEGSARQTLWVEQSDNGTPIFNLPSPLNNEKINEYATRNGMNAGDIYTFVFIVTSQAEADTLYKALGIASVEFDTIFRGAFGWVRLIVKNLASNETVITNDTELGVLFDVEAGGIGDATNSQETVGSPLSITGLQTFNADAAECGYAIGLIKSRRDIDLRSNTTLQVVNAAEFGLYWNDLLTAWQAGTAQIGASDLILEGGDE